MNFLLRVSVTYHPAFARLILGRWKEQSLWMKPPSLQILQGIYPDRPKDSEIHSDTLAPSVKIKIKKGKNIRHKKPSRKRKGNQQKRKMYTQIFSKNELIINAEEKGEEEGRKRKQTKQKMDGHGKHGEKKGKTGGTTTELPTSPLPCQKSIKTTKRKVKAER